MDQEWNYIYPLIVGMYFNCHKQLKYVSQNYNIVKHTHKTNDQLVINAIDV